MSEQQRESRGRTVDEAVREALLFMGLRREEVSVTVLQEPRSGILGLGRREAVVLVSKKSGKSKDGRGRRQESAGARTGARSSGRTRRDRSEEQVSDGSSGRREQARGGRDKAAADEAGGPEDKKPRERGQGRRRGGSAPPAKISAADAAPLEPGPTAPEDNGHERRNDLPDSDGQRRRRPRRRRKKQGSGAEGEPRDAQAASAVVAAESTDEERAGDDRGPSYEEGALPERVEAAVDDAVQDSRDSRCAEDRPSAAQNIVIGDVAAGSRCRPWVFEDTGCAPDILERVTTELMVRSGFPCRVQVQEGEYHRVKMVVDDRSAGILIGRYGNTVDAIEHIVDKIASKAAGERIRMNLDINNYRLRCEDQLVQRARAAAAEARETGEPVAMEPANGRDRRIVHLYIQETGDLDTYTDSGPDGKYVTICRPDQVPEQFRQEGSDDEDRDGPNEEPAVDIEVVIDVDAGAADHDNDPERRDAEV